MRKLDSNIISHLLQVSQPKNIYNNNSNKGRKKEKQKVDNGNNIHGQEDHQIGQSWTSK